MPHRKLVKIGDTPKLPSIQEFFTEMAARQHEEIRRLKAEVAGQPVGGDEKPHPPDPRKPVPDPWLLHPLRVKKSAASKKKSTNKKTSKKRASKPSRPGKAAGKTAKKGVGKKAPSPRRGTARG